MPSVGEKQKGGCRDTKTAELRGLWSERVQNQSPVGSFQENGPEAKGGKFFRLGRTRNGGQRRGG